MFTRTKNLLALLSVLLLCSAPALAEEATCSEESQTQYNQCIDACDTGFPECALDAEAAFAAHLREVAESCGDEEVDLDRRRKRNAYKRMVKAMMKAGVIEREDGRELRRMLNQCRPGNKK